MKKALLPVAAFLVALLVPLMAGAQTYPFYKYQKESLSTDGSQSVFTYSQSTCVVAISQQIGNRCAGSRASIRVEVLGPICGDASACPVDVLTRCQYIDNGDLFLGVEGCGFGGFCPYGGTLLGTTCAAPACPILQARDPETGKCAPTKPNKALGPACQTGGVSPLSIANPCHAGTGTKFQVETIYAGSGETPLVERLSYNSRLLADMDAVALTVFGRGWRGHYDRSLRVLSTGVVILRRETGQSLDFAPPTSGNVYVSNADIADRLERLTDGSGNTTGWKYTVAADDSTELYSSGGTLLSIAYRAGSTLTFAYSDTSTPPNIAPSPGHLISVTDQWGRALSYVYTALSRVSRMTDPAGGTYDFLRDANDRLVSITFPDASVRQFLYNEPAHTAGANLRYSLTGIIDENGGRFATYQYDSQGRTVSTEHAGGANKATLAYTSAFVTTTVTDALNVSRTYGLTTSHGMVRSTGVTGLPCPSCGPAAQTHDANGNVAGRTDWNGNRTNYTYDPARNLETSRTEGLTSAGATTPQTRTISTQWHSTFRLPSAIAEPLRITTFSYDPDGTTCGARGALCSKSVQATTDTNGSQAFSATSSGSPRTWTYAYNTNGSVLTVNGPRTDVPDVTTYTYYADNDADPGRRGNVATITNAAGHHTSISAYNAHGQPLTIVDANGLSTTLTYDARQRLKTRTVGGELTTYDYDLAGQLTKVTLPDGSFLSYTYDGAHRLTGLQDNLGNRVVYTLDAMGNRTLEEVRDPANALAQTRSRVFSNLNRLFQEVGASSQTTEYAYDDQGNVLTVKDPLNRITTNQYDALNRMRQVTSPAPISAVTQYAYDGIDQLASVTDPRSLVTGYTVNGLGNLTVQSSPDTGPTTSTHDAAGNLLTQTDAKGQVTTYAYDALNRVTLITFHDGSKQAYVYDQPPNGIGRLSSITETNPANQVTSIVAYGYDQHGRVTAETRTVAGVQHVLAYRYDSAGRLDQLTYPSGRLVSYSFDGLGRVGSVTTTKPGEQAQTVVSGVSYHPFGAVKGYTLGNGQAYTRGIDLDGRIASYTLGAQSFAIGYDAVSRISFISDVGTPANTNTYGYDNLDRLTSATLPATPYAYTYDAVGNRLSKGSDIYSYSPTSNRIASITPSSGPVRNFAFDANGSTTADGTNTYAYDVRGRMVQATSSIGATNYQVNALGQRIRKTNSLGDTVFHYDTQGKLIAETSGAGALVREYVYLGDLPVLLARPATSAGSEIILDNGSSSFSTTGTWPSSSAVAGFLGPNYQSHEANGTPPGAIVVDNTAAGFSVTGTWPASTSVSGHLGTNYQVHAPNGEPPLSVVADNASGSAVGTWPNSTAVAGYHGSNYQTHPAGTGTNTFTWTLNVPAAGSYELRARWTAHSNRATNAKYTVNHAGGAQVVTVNMEQGSAQWNTLGTFSFNAGGTTVSLSDDADGVVIADAVMIVPPGAAPNTATWALSVPASGQYKAYARWTQHPNRATNASYTVNHAAGATTVLVNQEAGGGTWFLLGTFGFDAGISTVTLTDQANDYVIADAVMLAPLEAAPNTATWTPNAAAGQYEIYARWTQHANRATNATYTVTHTAGVTAIAANQQQGGGAWNLLGTFTLSPGSAHKVALTDQANGFVIADAIRFVPLSTPAGSQYFFAHVDHLNSPRLITNAQQQAVWRHDQAEPFGDNPADENPSGLGVFEFPLRDEGTYFDKETNLLYNWHRYRDLSGGRFIQPDALGLIGGDLSLYVLRRNNPLSYIDDNGKQASAIGGAIGGAGRGSVFGLGGFIIGGAIGAALPWMCQVTDRDRCERECDREYDRGRDFCRAMSGMRGRNKEAFWACMTQVDERYVACYQDCAGR